MIRFIGKRFLVAIPLILGITFITFLFIQIAPGDFFDKLKLNPQVSKETIELYREKFNLDKPVVIQYFFWLKNIIKFDWGYSFSYNAPVIKVISSRALNTLVLSISVIVISWILVIPLAILAVAYRNRFMDRFLSFFSYLGISTPTFFLAFLLLYLASFSKFLPLGGMRSLRFDEFTFWGKVLDILRHLIIPTLVLSFGTVASLHRILRANLLEVLGSSYILAAKARGLSRVRIIYIHALKNALNPMITIFGYQFSSLLSGAALTEIICGWPGLGQVTLEAVVSQDLYLVMGTVLIAAVLLILGNLGADVLLALFDPRIRYQTNK
ncbi:MAG: ABC transporter permease [Candidatus Omnitrophica bacterium]|nr:ABC transporter permease [Candidatus Omnitrophota bacterium]